jgi:hypothetical protein
MKKMYLLIGGDAANISRPLTLTQLKHNIGYWLDKYGKVSVVVTAAA